MGEIIKLGVRSLEVLFFAGWVGAALVILLSGFEDIKTVLNPGQSETH